MKHFRKVCAVLLAALMVAVILPSTGLFNPAVNAAGVGEITNGDFETGDFTGWEHNEYGYTIYTKEGCSDSNVYGGTYSVRVGNHSSVQGTTLEQVIPVNTSATYSLDFYIKRSGSTTAPIVKVLLGNTNTTCLTEVVNKSVSIGSNYTFNSHSFSTGTYKYAKIQFVIATGASNDCYLDDVSISVTNAGNTSTHSAPTFVDFGALNNRPKTDADNEVKQPSFEETTAEAQWNTTTFIKNNLSVANDPDAKDGSKVLLYSNPTTTESWHYFDLELSSGGNYVLSAWVKSPFLSATNQGTASIGIIDPATDKFFMSTLANYKGHTSTPYLQIRSTATDNQWHLRSVTFFVGAAGTVKIGVYGKQSQLYIDDISVHLVTSGQPYVGDQTGTLTATNNSSKMYCESEDNLIPDCNMTGANAEKFWTTNASGWNNGFMNFNSDDARLEFNGTGASGKKIYHYIKWIPVEPGKDYTVSFDYRVTAKGSGQLRFLDNNIDLPVAFKTYSFSSTTSDWTTTSFTFNSGNYNRIAVAFTDGGGTAYFDDFRIFRTTDDDGNANGLEQEPEEEVFPTLKPTHPDQGVSRMEMGETGKLGLAFKFHLESSGIAMKTEEVDGKVRDYVGNYDNAKVEAFTPNTTQYKLVAAGAVMTNDGTVGQNPDLFVRENTNSASTVIDIDAKFLWEIDADGFTYAVRIVNIPESHKTTLIYARPYYIFEYNGSRITWYGDIQFESYEPQKDVNDGWLEWD